MSSNDHMINVSTLYGIWDIGTLSRFPQEAHALSLLQRLAAQVYPLCVDKKFKVIKLQEFFPVNKRLQGMNVNRGIMIYVRLRHPFRKEVFLPWNIILGIVLHELVHMLISPHNAYFYATLDKYWGFIENLQDKGITGDHPIFHNGVWIPKNGFVRTNQRTMNTSTVIFNSNTGGHRLGGSSSSSKTLGGLFPIFHTGSTSHSTSRNLRNKILEAAEQRLKRAKIMGTNGGEKLGTRNDSSSSSSTSHHHHHHPTEACGCGTTATLSTALPQQPEDKRQLLAWAAEQRLQDAYACGNSQEDIHITTAVHDEITSSTSSSNVSSSSSSSAATNTTTSDRPSTNTSPSSTDNVGSSSSSTTTVTNTTLKPSQIVDVIILDDNDNEIIQSIERPIIFIDDDDEEEEKEENDNDNKEDDEYPIFVTTEETREQITDTVLGAVPSSSAPTNVSRSSASRITTIIDLSSSSSSSSPLVTDNDTMTYQTDTYICSVCTYQGSRKGGFALACELCGSILSSVASSPSLLDDPSDGSIGTDKDSSTTIISTITPGATSGNPLTTITTNRTNENLPPNLLAWKLAADDVNRSSSSKS